MNKKQKKKDGSFPANLIIIIAVFIAITGGLFYYSKNPFTPEFFSSLPSISPVSMDTAAIVSSFGQSNSISRIDYNNPGIDFSVPSKTPVFASGGGEVLIAGSHGRYGLTVLIGHPADYTTIYSGLGFARVNVSDLVKKGDIIGTSAELEKDGKSIIHYEVRVDGKPIDPEELIDFK